MGGGVNLVERQRQLHACTHGIGGVWVGRVPYQKLKILYFWNGNFDIYMVNISKNLDQAMSLKKKVAEEEGGKHKEKTHIVLWA